MFWSRGAEEQELEDARKQLARNHSQIEELGNKLHEAEAETRRLVTSAARSAEVLVVAEEQAGRGWIEAEAGAALQDAALLAFAALASASARAFGRVRACELEATEARCRANTAHLAATAARAAAASRTQDADTDEAVEQQAEENDLLRGRLAAHEKAQLAMHKEMAQYRFQVLELTQKLDASEAAAAAAAPRRLASPSRLALEAQVERLQAQLEAGRQSGTSQEIKFLEESSNQTRQNRALQRSMDEVRQQCREAQAAQDRGVAELRDAQRREMEMREELDELRARLASAESEILRERQTVEDATSARDEALVLLSSAQTERGHALARAASDHAAQIAKCSEDARAQIQALKLQLESRGGAQPSAADLRPGDALAAGT